MMRRAKIKVLTVIATAVLALTAFAAPASAKPLEYFGGEVMNHPHVYLIFWGSNWNQQPGTRTEVQEMFAHVSGSSWQNIMTQYYDSSGPISTAVGFDYWSDESIQAPSSVNNKHLESEIEYAISQRGWPGGGVDNFYYVVPAPGSKYETGFPEGCGAHRFSGALNAPFGYDGWPEEGGWSAGCKLNDPTGEGRVAAAKSAIASHEYAEAVTDPMGVSFLGHPTGWGDAAGTGEIADRCAGFGGAPVQGGQLANGSWVEMLYDNTREECVLSRSLPVLSAVHPDQDDDTPGPRTFAQVNGTTDAFYRTPGGELGHDWYVPGSGWVHEVRPGPIAASSVPHASSQSNGTIDVFYRTTANQLGHDWYVPGVGWSHEVRSGSLASDPHVIFQSNGTIDVFYRTTANELGHDWYVPGVGWSHEVRSGPLASDPHVNTQESGKIDVFYRTTANQLGHDWYVPGVGWSHEVRSGSLASDPHVISQDNGTIDVFYRTTAGELGHDWYVQGAGWSHEARPGPLSSDPHPASQPNGTIDVFYRTPGGELGHEWYVPGGGWGHEVRSGPVAARPPLASTEAATAVGLTEATPHATVNPEGSPTSYYFEYGTTTSYGSKKPAAAESVGSEAANFAVAQVLSGLAEGTTYHFRVVATSPEGTVNGADKTFTTQVASVPAQLSAMSVTAPFNGSAGSLAGFASNWSTLGWAGGSPAKGEDSSTGWHTGGAYPTDSGAFFNPTIADTGSGTAAVATLAVTPGTASRFFSVWLDMPSPSGARAGYELRFTNVTTNTFNVTLSKWLSGTQTVLASQSNYTLANGSSFALADQGGTVSAWTNAGSGFAKLLSAADASFASGNAGLEGAGTNLRLTNFKAGSLLSGVANMNAALNALALNDSFATNENPLSGGGKWAALNWDNSTSGHNTGWISNGGWGPYDLYPTINGAYWQNASFADSGAGDAVATTLVFRGGSAGRYFSLWLDMPSPASARSGYELRLTETGVSVYEVTLSKWQAGVKTTLASKTGYSFPVNGKVALVDKGGTVSAWTNTASEFTQILSAADTAFISGYTGVEATGNNTRLKDFKSGPLPPF